MCRILFKSLGWFIENVIVRKAAASVAGANVEVSVFFVRLQRVLIKGGR